MPTKILSLGGGRRWKSELVVHLLLGSSNNGEDEKSYLAEHSHSKIGGLKGW